LKDVLDKDALFGDFKLDNGRANPEVIGKRSSRAGSIVDGEI
jgi:hypothetical protein